MTKVRAAIENKVRPTAILFQEQPGEAWTKFDFLLLEAYQMLQDETCNQCGSPIWICRNEFATNVGFKVKSVKCFAKAELERHAEIQEKRGNKKKTYGEQDVVVPYTYDDGEFPSRAGYFEGLYKQHSQTDDV